jgi:type I restriction enzyme M protein
MTAGPRSEEDVKFKFLVPYLVSLGYKQDCMAFNVAVPVQEGRKKKTIFADAVVYKAKDHKAPLIVCETKAPTEILSREAREQAISYARLLPSIAPLALLTNGAQVQVFHTLDKSRRPSLPKRSELENDIIRFVLSEDKRELLREEAKHDLFIIDDVRTFKTILKSCHNEIRNNEGLDPTAAFDEMSKVMFCKLYEEKKDQKGNRFRLSVFDDSQNLLNVNIVRQIFEEAKDDPFYKGLFHKETQINLKDRTIRRLVELFQEYDLGLTAFDVKGEAFEYFLGDTFTGGLGEYFTPRNVVEFMVEAVDPKIGNKIIDPFCGTGGFLIYAFEVVSDKIRLNDFAEEEKQRWRSQLSDASLYGTDWKERTSQACKMNMMVHGDGNSGIFMHDGLTDVPGVITENSFQICVTNPPFGSFETDSKVLKRYELGAGRKSQDRVILGLERSIRLVKPGGTICIVVIDGILNNRSTAYVRDYIRANTWVKAVISLNKETFEGYGARAKTSILILERKQSPDSGEQKPVFLSIARNTGLAPNGALIPGNVLPEVLLDYRAFLKGNFEAGQHSESWKAEISDRLDAEYYANGPVRTEVNIEILRSDFSSVQTKVAGINEALSGSQTFLSGISTTKLRLRDLLDEVSVREKITSDRTYRLLGVRWWGEGTFVREEKLGREIKGAALYAVSPGLIIYNRLFAFKGSFAIVTNEQAGCYVSNEFPTFALKPSVKDNAALAKYIVFCLNSPSYLHKIDTMSTGSTKTSRNRFNQELLLDMFVHVPKDEDELKRVVQLLDQADELRRQQERLSQLSKSLREGVLRMLPAPEATEGPTDGDAAADVGSIEPANEAKKRPPRKATKQAAR